ncbi:MAG: hypothetical protein RIC89_13645 [Pseudomonadales bacterium]
MKATLEERIDQQERWTFHECLGLATEYNVKVRVVIVTVFARGKEYIDGEAPGHKSKPA